MATQKSAVTCHVLDAALGKPAAGVGVHLQELHQVEGGNFSFNEIARSKTDRDGRCDTLLPPSTEGTKPKAELYKIVFKTKEYFEQSDRTTFYPWVEITFELDPSQHYHIPLLISPYSYTTYRGS